MSFALGNILLQQPQSSEERKDSNIHLPVLSKKDTKKEMVSSVSNYRSPTLSPCFMKPEYEVKKTETDDAERHQSSQKRGNSASRGFKSRKTKSRPSKYSSKQREENLDILLMNRNNSDLEYLMQEYTRRQGLSESCKVFILTGQHDFMRRSLKKRGWVENKNYNSCAYHFKWCYNDSDYDYQAENRNYYVDALTINTIVYESNEKISQEVDLDNDFLKLFYIVTSLPSGISSF